MYNGRKLDKPFVEKPEDADRHDIYIYYPREPQSLPEPSSHMFTPI